jgi:hypothetical protein
LGSLWVGIQWPFLSALRWTGGWTWVNSTLTWFTGVQILQILYGDALFGRKEYRRALVCTGDVLWNVDRISIWIPCLLKQVLTREARVFTRVDLLWELFYICNLGIVSMMKTMWSCCVLLLPECVQAGTSVMSCHSQATYERHSNSCAVQADLCCNRCSRFQNQWKRGILLLLGFILFQTISWVRWIFATWSMLAGGPWFVLVSSMISHFWGFRSLDNL